VGDIFVQWTKNYMDSSKREIEKADEGDKAGKE
jgi:hypothetical protein